MSKINSNELLNEALTGNLSNFCKLLKFDHKELVEASHMQTSLVLNKMAVVKVLESIKNSKVDRELTQKWASLMRWGLLPTSEGVPRFPLEIDYNLEDEEVIVEALARLDEQGDLIDGYIDDKELDELINSLK